MTREEFDSLVRTVEERFAGRPGALRFRVAMLALIGYGGLLAWLGIILLISVGFFLVMIWADVQGKIACGILGCFVLFGGGYAALRALLVRVQPPQGRAVTRGEAPELFSVLDELQSQLHSASFHRVLIEPVCNAAVVQVPRLGVFGWQQNYLLIGLPLLDGLSRDEMRAVLAHEFTHLSREHGRFSHWLYRLRRSWQEIFQQLSRPRVRGEVSMRPLLVKFVDWFWPRFNAHAFVLSRTNEYEADFHSARLTGKNNAASALMRLNIVGRHLEEKIWPDLFQLANEQAEPPADVFCRVRDGIRAGAPDDDASKWLDEALKMTSTNSDTHPCLTERLRALDALPPGIIFEKNPPLQSAAEILLGASLEKIRADVQKNWAKDIVPKWRDRHGRATALKHRLSSIEEAAPASADAERLWDRAIVLLDLEGGKAARPLLQRILEMRPDHVPARFHLGRLLLDDNLPEGIEHLQRAMELDEQCVPQACSLLHDHYRFAGQAEKLRELDARMDRYEKSLAASRAERREVSAKDNFLSHGMSDEELRRMREMLGGENGILRAHLARKELKHFPTQRLFVLCVYPRRAWHGFADHDADRALVNRLSQKLQLPGRLMVFTPTGSFRPLAKKIAVVPDAEFFRNP
jgi:Zn-dependent protease with chaperone function